MLTDDEKDYAELARAIQSGLPFQYNSTAGFPRHNSEEVLSMPDGIAALHRMFDRWLQQAHKLGGQQRPRKKEEEPDALTLGAAARRAGPEVKY